jgi:hypothetical protein
VLRVAVHVVNDDGRFLVWLHHEKERKKKERKKERKKKALGPRTPEDLFQLREECCDSPAHVGHGVVGQLHDLVKEEIAEKASRKAVQHGGAD